MRETVQVLLSSYNGEKYIKEQLDSILAQEGVQIRLLVRDDGSTDRTKEILEAYQNSYENIAVLYGENVGVIKSFFALIEAAEERMLYTAFSDQDDVWLPDKLERAVRLLKENEERQRNRRHREGMCSERRTEGQEKHGETACGTETAPVVYCSAKQLVDAKLHPLKSAIHYHNVKTEFGNALVENMCTGCTCVVNKDLLRLIKGRTPKFTVMHDFWIYLVGTCFGTVVYDKRSRILYRQHGGNELGAASSLLENYKRRVKYYKKHRGQLGRQAAEFLRIYQNEMPEEKRRLAEELVKAKADKAARRKLLNERKLFRQRKSDDWIFRILLLTGRL